MTTTIHQEKQKRRIQQQRKTYLQKGQFKNVMGNYIKIMADYHQDEPFLTLGPNYIFFIGSFLVVNFISILTLHLLNNQQDLRALFLLSFVVIVFLDIFWLATAFINPGIAVAKLDQIGDFCEQCKVGRGISVELKQGRRHCRDCDVCIDQQEHHFKIIGGCIGKNNFIAFKLLLLGIFLWGMTMITIIPIIQHI